MELELVVGLERNGRVFVLKVFQHVHANICCRWARSTAIGRGETEKGHFAYCHFWCDAPKWRAKHKAVRTIALLAAGSYAAEPAALAALRAAVCHEGCSIAAAPRDVSGPPPIANVPTFKI